LGKLHRRYGRLPWKDLFAPAIYLASNRFPVSELIAGAWKAGLLPSYTDDSCRKVFARNGEAPGAGEFYRNPDLARALKLVAEQAPAWSIKA
jgi:gamma-glutamyltranspeptidase/glutathione hydrolase